MAGHSKFANIQHRKGGQDKKRAQAFTKIAREIQAAVKLGGPDPNANPRLFRAMAAGRAINMPKDNIQRAIDKGGGASAENLDEIRYEGFGPGGVGIIVECLSDNRNRTAGDVRAAFAKNGGNMGESNSVSFAWKRVGEVRYPLAAASEDAMMEAAIDAAESRQSLADGFDRDLELQCDGHRGRGVTHVVRPRYVQLETSQVAIAMDQVELAGHMPRGARRDPHIRLGADAVGDHAAVDAGQDPLDVFVVQ